MEEVITIDNLKDKISGLAMTDVEYLLQEIKKNPMLKTSEDIQPLTNWYYSLEDCQKVLDIYKFITQKQ
tara:strand:+ start:443 stop:649 length:207 start_codon:yes stop_codon:yes gene_type:complete